MPAEAIAPPPAAAPATAAPATPAPAPAAASAPPPNMHDPLPSPGTPARPGSAREKMRQESAKKWGEPAPAATPAPAAKPAEAPKPGDTTPKPEAKPGDEPPVAQEAPPEITPEQKKKNPWVLVRESSKRIKELETQLSEGVKGSLAETEKAQYLERIEKTEAKLKTYEEEIRFKSYEKSDEFRTKYEEPYQKAWNKHMKELSEVPVLAEDGTSRMAKQEDLLELAGLPLGAARKLATEKWGDFANEAMTARKEIRDLFDAKESALTEARKTGADREKEFQEKTAKWRTDVQKHIKDNWEAANQAALDNPSIGEFIKPVDGDPKRNEILTKGFSLFDRAFGQDPMNPQLSPEDRAKNIQERVAARNRNAAYGVLKYMNARLRTENEALKKANAEFKGSEPPAGGRQAAGPGAPTGQTARDRMHAAGEKYGR